MSGDMDYVISPPEIWAEMPKGTPTCGAKYVTHTYQQQIFQAMFEKSVEALYEIVNAFVEIVQEVIERIKQAAISLARFFLKLQLLEWKLPYPIADFLSKNLYWVWALRLGFNWLKRKYALKE